MSRKPAPLVLALALALAPVFAPLAQSLPLSPAPLLPYSEVRSGLRGTGYTVLQGDSVTPFAAEVLGTVEQGAAAPRAIVCRLSGANLENTGVLAAMSGSPVYVDGKLLGAVAYTWPFAKEPLCGVTPAEDLFAVGERGRRAETALRPGPPVSLEAFVQGLTAMGRVQARHGDPPGSFGNEQILERLTAGGFAWSAAVRGDTSAGTVPSPEAQAPGPGGMIGVQLVSGDVQFTAFGTVSWVEADRFLAFGHGVLGLGSAELPVVSARVVATVPSLATGFKLSQAGRPLGVVTEDRPTGVFGRFGVKARTLPVRASFRCQGLPARDFRFDVIRHPTLTPALLGAALSNLYAHLEDPVEPKLVRLRATTLKLRGRSDLALEDQAFSGPLAMAAATDYLSGLIELLSNNPYQAAPLEGLELAVEVEPGNRSTTVEAAWLDRSAAVRGEPLALTVRLQPFQGPARTLTCSIPTKDLPAGEHTLWAGGTFSLLPNLTSAARERPGDAEGYLRYLKEIPPSGKVTIAVAAQDQASVLMHRRVGSLPPSLGALLARQKAETSTAESAKRLLWISTLEAEGAVSGLVELTFSIKEESDE